MSKATLIADMELLLSTSERFAESTKRYTASEHLTAEAKEQAGKEFDRETATIATMCSLAQACSINALALAVVELNEKLLAAGTQAVEFTGPAPAPNRDIN